ncbi:MAG: cupin domain-containing protein [Candidatus Bathyarchaeota archaeon B63]|nr:MAG: cupin domain-containing protein [Candidatus Bathyarchaeota archaeon B63]
MIYIKHIPSIKKQAIEDMHGATSLYQIFWQSDEHGARFGEKKPEPMKSFSNFARITVQPGGTNQIHVHEDVEQVYIVLRGRGTVQVGDEKAEVKAGDAVFLPAKVPHGFVNTGDKPAVLLLIGTRVYE